MEIMKYLKDTYTSPKDKVLALQYLAEAKLEYDLVKKIEHLENALTSAKKIYGE